MSIATDAGPVREFLLAVARSLAMERSLTYERTGSISGFEPTLPLPAAPSS